LDNKIDSKTIRQRFKIINKIFQTQQKSNKERKEKTGYVMDIHEREN
jgi:hypothetical protein